MSSRVVKFRGNVHDTAREIVNNNLNKLKSNDVVLIKGSYVNMLNNVQIVVTHVIND